MTKVSTKSGFIAARAANSVFTLCDNAKESFNRLWLWPARAMVGGKRVLNVGDVYVGERTDSGDFTPDVLVSSDLPLPIKLPVGETKLLRDVIFQADNAGDGVFFKYWALFILMTLAFVLNGQAQERSLREATAAEMRTATIGVPAVVTPRLLGNSLFYDPLATSFAFSNTISSPDVLADLTGYYRELKSSGVISNVMVSLAFESRFGTNCNLIGPKISFTNLFQNNYGAVFGATNTASMMLPQSLSNFTVFVQYKNSASDLSAWAARGGGGPLWVLNNTNTGSVFGWWNESGGGNNRYIYAKQAAGSYVVQTTWYLDIYSFWAVVMPNSQSIITAIGRNNGTNYYWSDTRPGYFAQTASGTNAAATCSDFLNQLFLGVDPNVANRNTICQIASILIVAAPPTQAMVNSVERANTWLDVGTDITFFCGDSRTSEYNFYNNAIIENSWPYFAFLNTDRRYLNLSRGGTTTANVLANGATGQPWDFREVTNLLSGTKIKTGYIVPSLGFNDYYINGSTFSTVQANLNTLLTPAKAAGAKIVWAGLFDAFTNIVSYSYSAAYWTNMQNQNAWAVTNSLFDGYIPFDSFITQNLLNKTNGYSYDGIHFGYSCTNIVVPCAMGGLFNSKPWLRNLQ